MDQLDSVAHAVKDCARCGARAFYWRSAIVARDPHFPTAQPNLPHGQPAWTCMNCGYIEPHERRQAERQPPPLRSSGTA